MFSRCAAHPAVIPEYEIEIGNANQTRTSSGSLSALVFCGILLALASVDARVRDRVERRGHRRRRASPWGSRVTDLADALTTAVRHQSIENAPLMVFATVGAVLFLFMVIEQ